MDTHGDVSAHAAGCLGMLCLSAFSMKINLEQFFVSAPGPTPDYRPTLCHKLFSLRLVYFFRVGGADTKNCSKSIFIEKAERHSIPRHLATRAFALLCVSTCTHPLSLQRMAPVMVNSLVQTRLWRFRLRHCQKPGHMHNRVGVRSPHSQEPVRGSPGCTSPPKQYAQACVRAFFLLLCVRPCSRHLPLPV